MKLYHGTSLRNLIRILAEGHIRPRPKDDKGNWGHTYVSHEGLVYLTDTYPLFYAYQACKDNDKPVILEIEIDEGELYPDEDFIRLVMEKQYKVSIKDADRIMKVKRIDVQSNKHLALDSLEGIGTACYHGFIPVEWITRICILWDKWLVYNHIDHVVSSVMGHEVLKDRYQPLLKYLFDAEKYQTMQGFIEFRNPVMEEMAERARKHFAVLDSPFTIENLHEFQKKRWMTTEPNDELVKGFKFGGE